MVFFPEPCLVLLLLALDFFFFLVFFLALVLFFFALVFFFAFTVACGTGVKLPTPLKVTLGGVAKVGGAAGTP